MDTVELARLLAIPTRVQRGNVNPTWKGPIIAESGPTIAYIKILPPTQLLSECVCTVIGRALDLGLPKGFVVEVPKELLPDFEGWGGHQSLLAYGSEDAQHPAFHQYLQSGDSLAKTLFLQWPKLNRLIGFDEWIANIDRHLNNFLYDGSGNFIPIDHSHAFTGPSWEPSILKPDVYVTNRLLDEFLKFDDLSKERLKRAVNAFATECQNIQLNGLANSSQSKVYISEEHIEAITSFLKQRILELLQLVNRHVGTPELSLS